MRINDVRLFALYVDEMTPKLKISCIERVSIGDKYIILKENHLTLQWFMLRWCVELMEIGAELRGVSQIQNGFHPMYWYKTHGGYVFQTLCKLPKFVDIVFRRFPKVYFYENQIFNFQQSGRQAPVASIWNTCLRNTNILPYKVHFTETSDACTVVFVEY
jgi:hypothetical protein